MKTPQPPLDPPTYTEEETLPEILPCPFQECGSTDVSLFPNRLFVFCRDCKAEGPAAMTQKEAIVNWNSAKR